MKQDIYLILYNKIKNEAAAVFLANVCYFLLCVCYFIRSAFLKKDIVRPNIGESRRMVEAVSPKPVSAHQIVNQPVDPEVDLSVIIPVYNYEHVLENMLRSVLNQRTRFSYEVVVVDDGSREEAKCILRRYQDVENVRVIFQENQGISGARNTGLNAIRGKYVMFVDCDDTVHEDIVEKLMGEACRTGADIVMGAHALVREKNGAEISRRKDIYPAANLERYRDGDVIMNYPGLPWGKVYRRSLFEQVRFPVNYWYEDTVIQFLIFRLAKSFSYVPEVLYDYRWYEGNYSKVQSKSSSRVVEHYWIVEYMLEQSRKIGLKADPVEYKVLLRHLGGYLYHAVAGLDEDVKKALFDLACHIVEKHKVAMPNGMNLKLRELEKSFLHRDYAKWVLVSRSL
ncbi:MAG: glycosyltransferase family 2 protein [Oscillospiraceae bacterium]|nr:glycosyltransferase family 2 protein [Oscillospiraceae bacterium]